MMKERRAIEGDGPWTKEDKRDRLFYWEKKKPTLRLVPR
jgi:hypothetical protein